MCLLTNRKTAKTAKEDIICYKVLFHYEGLFEHYWITPCCHQIIELSEMAGLKDICPKTKADEQVIKDFNRICYRVNGGYIHTYTTKNDVPARCDLSFHTFKCIIPKGTKYYEGIDDRGKPSLASKKIRIIEIDDI